MAGDSASAPDSESPCGTVPMHHLFGPSAGGVGSLGKPLRTRNYSFVSWVGGNTSKTCVHCIFNLHLKVVLSD